MDIISFNEAATANGRIEKVIAQPDSVSGLVTMPSVVATGEVISIPSGRTVVHPNLQVDGTLEIDGTLFIPSGGIYTADELDVTVVKQNGNVVANAVDVVTSLSLKADITALADKANILNPTFTQGIKVGNTAIADANTLDWYEEGTFTPTIQGATTAGVGTYSAQTGKYTRVGNRVDVSIQLTWSAHTGTGFMKLVGFPYNFANTHGFLCSGYSLTITGQLYIEVGTGSSLGLLYALNNGTASQLTMDASATVICNFTYFA